MTKATAYAFIFIAILNLSLVATAAPAQSQGFWERVGNFFSQEARERSQRQADYNRERVRLNNRAAANTWAYRKGLIGDEIFLRESQRIRAAHNANFDRANPSTQPSWYSSIDNNVDRDHRDGGYGSRDDIGD